MRRALPIILLVLFVASPALGQGRRYYANTIFSWWPQYQDIGLFQRFVSESKQKGMNSISIDVPWSVEDRQGNYDFKASDERIDHIVSQNMSVFIRVNTSVLGNQVPHWLTDDMLMCTPDGKVYQRESDGASIPSIAHPAVRKKMVAFFDAVARHYGQRYGERAGGEHPIAALSAAFNLYMASEYQPNVELDYSKAAKDDFARWAKSEYRSLSTLNSLWGTSYAGWQEVKLDKAHPTAKELYFSFTLARLMDEIGNAVHRAHPNMRVGMQSGCLWDEPSRRTTNAARLLKNLDWLLIADAPLQDHGFAANHLRTVAGGRRMSNQVDGPTQLGATSGRYFNQGYRSYQHGCDALIVSNWDLENLKNNFTWPFLRDMGRLARGPLARPKPDTAIYMSTWDLINSSAQVEEYRTVYARLTEEGKTSLDIVDDSAIAAYPGILSRYKTIYLPANWTIPDSSRSALSQVTDRLVVEKPLVAGTLDEYGRKTQPLVRVR